MGYQKETIKGFGYGFLGKAIMRGIGIVRISLLARILNPLQFGIFGIASLVLALLETLTETGINVVLIQGKKDLKEYVSSAWVVSIVRGVMIFFLILALRPIIIGFFNEPESGKILALIAVVPLIKGFINPSIIKYRMDLEFSKEYRLRVALFLIESVIAIIVSVILGSAIGIVYGLIVGAVIEVFFSHLYMKPQPTLKYSKKKIFEIVRFGKWVNLTGIATYVSNEGDDFFVGKLLQTTSLGLYRGVYKIAILPLTEIAQVSTQITLPVYSKIADDKDRLRKAFNKIVLSMSSLVIIFGAVIYLFSETIIRLLLGDEWLSAVSVLKVLAIYGVLKSLINLSKSLLFSLKKQKVVAIFSTIEMSVLLVSITPFIMSYGLIGAAYSSVLSVAISLPLIAIYIYLRVL